MTPKYVGFGSDEYIELDEELVELNNELEEELVELNEELEVVQVELEEELVELNKELEEYVDDVLYESNLDNSDITELSVFSSELSVFKLNSLSSMIPLPAL